MLRYNSVMIHVGLMLVLNTRLTDSDRVHVVSNGMQETHSPTCIGDKLLHVVQTAAEHLYTSKYVKKKKNNRPLTNTSQNSPHDLSCNTYTS